MNRFTRVARATVAGSALLVLANARVTPLPALAQAVPSQRVLMRGAPDAGRAQPHTDEHEHVVYGRIDALHGSVLSVRTRAGKAQLVDASRALRSGAYSEPLFVGKIVVVTGSYAGNRMLRASSVMRMGSLDAGTPADR